MRKGFTLLEITIVIVIIGILIALAIPNFIMVKAIVYQNRIKNTLQLIYEYEMATFAEKGHFEPYQEGQDYGLYILMPYGKYTYISPRHAKLESFKFPPDNKYYYLIIWRTNIKQPYLLVYAIAGKSLNNDLDGDSGWDVWVAQYNLLKNYPPIISFSNDLKD